MGKKDAQRPAGENLRCCSSWRILGIEGTLSLVSERYVQPGSARQGVRGVTLTTHGEGVNHAARTGAQVCGTDLSGAAQSSW